MPYPSLPTHCDPYWEHADWLPPWYLLDRWCQQDERCRQAKQQALLSAGERGDVNYRRSDGKTFDDPVHELADRGLLLVERDSFNAWATRIEGKSPLAMPPRPMAPLPPTPAWAYAQRSQVPTAATPSHNGQAVDEVPEREVVDQDVDTNASKKSTSLRLNLPARDVPSDEIIAAFPVMADEIANTEWWKTRMREAKDYGLTDARTYAGRLREQSRWQPHLIAFWLVTKGHMKAKVVKRIVMRSFPDWADAADYCIDD